VPHPVEFFGKDGVRHFCLRIVSGQNGPNLHRIVQRLFRLARARARQSGGTLEMIVSYLQIMFTRHVLAVADPGTNHVRRELLG